MADQLVIEEQQCHDAARDGCIGKVEDRREEHAMLTGIDRHPRGHVPFDEGKVEHIDYLAVKELAVSISVGHKLGHLREGWGVENESVEEAIDDVACRSRRNQREAHDVPRRSSALDFAINKPTDEAHRHDAEEGEEEFASPQFPTERHAVVLHKNEAEPIGDFNALSQIHARLDTDLDDLVDDKNGHEKGDGKNMLVLSGHESVFLNGDDSLEVVEVNRFASRIAQLDGVGKHL